MYIMNDYVTVYNSKEYKNVHDALAKNNKYNKDEEFVIPDLCGMIMRKKVDSCCNGNILSSKLKDVGSIPTESANN